MIFVYHSALPGYHLEHKSCSHARMKLITDATVVTMLEMDQIFIVQEGTVVEAVVIHRAEQFGGDRSALCQLTLL